MKKVIKSTNQIQKYYFSGLIAMGHHSGLAPTFAVLKPICLLIYVNPIEQQLTILGLRPNDLQLEIASVDMALDQPPRETQPLK